MMTKLTLISVNGRAVFAPLPVGSDGKVRADLHAIFGLRRCDCIAQR